MLIPQAIVQQGGSSTPTFDPVDEYFGTADHAFEFDTSSLTGLTALGTPDAEIADTRYSSWLWYADNAGSNTWVGRYLDGLSQPYTGITRCTSIYPYAGGTAIGLFIGSNFGALDVLDVTDSNQTLHIDNWTATSGGSQGNAYGAFASLRPDYYFGIVVNSSTSVDYYWSLDGMNWLQLLTGRNPGNTGTLDAIGVGVKANGTTWQGAFDYLRVWDSAKTFPGY